MLPEPDVERHPWNVDFTWADHAGPFRRLTAAQARQFDEVGFVVLEDLFTDEELAPVIDAIDELEAETDRQLAARENGRFSIAEHGAITFTLFPLMRSEAARSFSSHPVFADVCHDLIGPNVRLYHDQAVYKKPEKPRRFPWHQDNGYSFIEPQHYLTCWVALTDATEHNGCPQVVPGMHKLGTLRHRFNDPLGWEIFEDHPRAAMAPVRKGGMLAFSSLTPHLTGPNTTDSVRKAYIIQYAPEGARVRGVESAAPSEGLWGDNTKLANDPLRQYPLLVDGVRVEPPPLA